MNNNCALKWAINRQVTGPIRRSGQGTSDYGHTKNSQNCIPLDIFSVGTHTGGKSIYFAYT